ncbi:ATP synthase F1 subunit epsilon [[Mycoplasma] mobile]|uniref:ATP synthase epsilon chain n=1 Tax=Mycoplasma mobile (strain ATCC 43663 / 163K / NCTC 11711) TaxID=267748 RepID=ATPE_MYCM1|nr:ATP synthase F1 subunit epsilon [[Mycoplasma] mobile]Q6KI83.1 RecName: Full=ATP synthase epsilon chain; AltName: Full=ATP synthase F1 sector epsilon subunit; AltName: Full=F-ATPase epsilon subunit [Mycoplasma mobile 163K]AAT27693.1 ATP synthase epsilon chain [Mycoplasma mobile 163K]
MSKNKTKLIITTPQGYFFNDDVEIVTLKTTEGYIGIQKDSQSLIASIKPSKLFINQINSKDLKICAISGGIAFIDKNEIKIITDAIEFKEDIDLERAKKGKEIIEQKLKKPNLSKSKIEEYNLKIEKANNRINVKNNSDTF